MSDNEKAAEAPRSPDIAPSGRPASRDKLTARPAQAGPDMETRIRRAMARYPIVRAHLARDD